MHNVVFVGLAVVAFLVVFALLICAPALWHMALRRLMVRPARHYQFEEGDSDAEHHLLAEIENGPDANNRSIEQLARHIKASHSRYGGVELTAETFASFVKNFNAGVYGQKIFIDVAHKPDAGAAAEIVKISTKGDQLLAELQWTPKGMKAFNDDGYRYFSIDFTDDYEDRETGARHGPTLLGAGFVTRPFIKHMRPSDGPGRMYFSENGPAVPGYLKLTEAGDMNKFLKQLREALKAKGLAAGVISQILASFEEQAQTLGDDEAQLKALCDTWTKHGTQLADEIGNKEVTLTIETPAAQGGNGGTTLSEADIDARFEKMLAEREKKAADDKAVAERKLSEVVESFDAQLDAAKGLSEDVRDTLKKDWHGTLTADMPAAQIKTFADLAIKSGNEQAASAKLKTLGYDVGGQGQHVTLGDEPAGVRLGEEVRKGLGNSNSGAMLRLPEQAKLPPLARRVLAEFDRIHGPRVMAEAKRLAGEDGVHIADGEFPIAAQRQVIVETLSDLAILDVISTNVDSQAQATTQIPYETRDSGGVRNEGIVYESQPIPYAGVHQRMDTAYIAPRKIAMLMSNEMIHFSRSSQINWDAWARNIASNSRLMRELVTRAIANTMLRSADSYMSVAISEETITVAGDGQFKTAQFPVVRPYQPRDLQGNAVGTAENTVTVTDGVTTVKAWDGSGTQAAGTYWRLTSVNLGTGQLVDKDGAPKAASGTVKISYTHATNIVKVDLDTPADTKREDHLNEILFAIGRRKANLADDRFVNPNMALMSHTLNQTCTEAEAFTAQAQRPGINAGAMGNLESVKGIPGWATNEPGIDLGDERILIGERGTLSYTIAKPFATGTPFEAVHRDSGHPTGEKVAYGEEYSAIHVPKPLRDRFTSVLVYSAGNR